MSAVSTVDTPTRFWAKVEKTNGCWLWTGGTARGYGQFRLGGGRGSKNVRAHRYAYELLVGPIPAGLEIDHTCENKLCVRPDHLEPVTKKVNLERRFKREGIR